MLDAYSPETVAKLRDDSDAQVLFTTLGSGNLNGLSVKFQEYDPLAVPLVGSWRVFLTRRHQRQGDYRKTRTPSGNSVLAQTLIRLFGAEALVKVVYPFPVEEQVDLLWILKGRRTIMLLWTDVVQMKRARIVVS